MLVRAVLLDKKPEEIPAVKFCSRWCYFSIKIVRYVEWSPIRYVHTSISLLDMFA